MYHKVANLLSKRRTRTDIDSKLQKIDTIRRFSMTTFKCQSIDKVIEVFKQVWS